MFIQDFYERYQFLMGPKQSDLGRQIQQFLESLGFGSEDIQIGKTKVLYMYTLYSRCMELVLSSVSLYYIV